MKPVWLWDLLIDWVLPMVVASIVLAYAWFFVTVLTR